MILRRYVLRELLRHFFWIAGGLTLFIYAIFLLDALRQSRGLGWEYLRSNLVPLLVQVLPYTTLAAVTIAATTAYGRLAADGELDAMRAAGVAVRRMLRPAALLGLAAAAGLAYIFFEAVPDSNLSLRNSRSDMLRLALRALPAGPREFPFPGGVFSYGSSDGGELRDVSIKLMEEKGALEIEAWAETARVEFHEETPVLRLRRCRVVTHGKHPGETEAEEYPFPILGARREHGANRPFYMDLAQLCEAARSEENEAKRREAAAEIHRRTAWSLLPVGLALLGASIGVLVRKSSRLAGLGVGLPPLVAILLLMLFAQALGSEGVLPPIAAAYGPLALLGAATVPALRAIRQ